VDVQADGLRRYAPDAEAAVYFACLEALQNVAKHGHATAAHVKIAQQNDELIFSVADNGVGIEPSYLPGSGLGNMADRLAAFSGRLEVVGKPGGGTTVTGHLLVGAVESSS
jgi:signal transduction histidine kinase